MPESEEGGALFAYEIPQTKPLIRKKKRIREGDNDEGVFETEGSRSDENDGWKRHTLFRGFKVRGWGGIFSPGKPYPPSILFPPSFSSFLAYFTIFSLFNLFLYFRRSRLPLRVQTSSSSTRTADDTPRRRLHWICLYILPLLRLPYASKHLFFFLFITKSSSPSAVPTRLRDRMRSHGNSFFLSLSHFFFYFFGS